MMRNICKILLVGTLAALMLAGCGNGTDKTVAEVNPIVEMEEEKEEIQDMEVAEEVEVSETQEAEPLPTEIYVVDESILDEPLPETIEELEAILRAIPNGQLLSDFMFKVLDELNYEKVSDVEWCDILGAYIEEIKETNPQLLQEFYDAEVK